MVSDAGSDNGRAAFSAAGDRVDVRTGTVSAACPRRRQQYSNTNGAAPDVLGKRCSEIANSSWQSAWILLTCALIQSWQPDYAGVDHLHFVSRRSGASGPAEKLRASGTRLGAVDGS